MATQTSEVTRGQPAAVAARPPLTERDRGRQTELQRSWRRFRRYRPGLVGLAFILGLVVVAILAGPIAPHSPTEVQTRLRGDAPTREYPLGNDSVGRDVLSRLIYGTRVALTVGLGATAIAVTIGVVIGATAGYFGDRSTRRCRALSTHLWRSRHWRSSSP